LLLAVLGSVISLVRMIGEMFFPVPYYWWGAVGMIGSTAILAVAIYFKGLADKPKAAQSA